MGCTVVVGGQFGSEGKGKVVALEASLGRDPWVVRCGGPNSGHTASVDGKEFIFRQIPAAAGHPNSKLFLAAGCAIDEAVLLEEVEKLDLAKDRVVVDPQAVLIEDADRDEELAIVGRIASTGSGTGSALARRMLRMGPVRLARDSEPLRERLQVRSVSPMLHDHLDRGGRIIVEGTQGFGLSLLHGSLYPFVTSRDTTAGAFISEVGLSPMQVSDIVMVVRTFPIRVGGDSGPLPGEITWQQIKNRSGAPDEYPEYTSVTKRLRRVGEFNLEAVVRACRYNRPTALAIMGLDRIDYANHRIDTVEELTPKAAAFLHSLSDGTGVGIRWAGTGFGTAEHIHLVGQHALSALSWRP